MILLRIVCLLIGFVFGSIPTGYVVARMYGKDLRTMGSGNTGSTNALRSLGKKAGALTFAGDILKAVVPLIITAHVFGENADTRYLVTMYTGLGAVLGHDFSPWLHFNGGKGIATSAGVILFTDPGFFGLSFVCVVGIALFIGYVSLGSITAAVVYLIVQLYWLLGAKSFGWSFYPESYSAAYTAELIFIALIMSGLALVRHKANIIRLIHGNENKFFKKSK